MGWCGIGLLCTPAREEKENQTVKPQKVAEVVVVVNSVGLGREEGATAMAQPRILLLSFF